MSARVVKLMIRYKDASGTWRRSPAARGANGRVKPGHALVDGQVVAVKNGRYDIRSTVNRRTIYEAAGKSASVADARRQQLELKSVVIEHAKEAGVEIVEAPVSRSLRATAAAYIKNAEKRRAFEAALQARLVTTEFMKIVKCVNVDEVSQDDIFRYHEWLRKNQCGDRTVANKHARLASWLKFGGIDPRNIPPKPRYEEKLPDVYSSEQTRVLLAKAKPYMRICILLGLKCGLRDQEMQHVEFRDVNWQDRTLRVRAKPQWEFTVKTWEQRNVPVPADVLKALKDWQSKSATQTLILGTKNRAPNGKLLLMLKGTAKRAGLNCGRCDGCQKLNQCQEFTLHRLRRTYITTMLRGGIDLRSVQAYAGHHRLETTMRYLAPESAPEAQAKVNAVKW